MGLRRVALYRQYLPGTIGVMIVILVIGMVVDTVFTRVDLTIRRHRGLLVGTQS